MSLEQLVQLQNSALDCHNCRLSETRTNVVFGVGNINRPLIAFVGEAPGSSEDEQGIPFVGRAGNVLTGWIQSLGIRRSDVYITNICLCRPPNNRRPLPDEKLSCRPYLEGQLKLVKPQVIVTLGVTAITGLLSPNQSIGPMADYRGKWLEWNSIPVRSTFHPAYILRNKNAMSSVTEDLKAVKDYLIKRNKNEA